MAKYNCTFCKKSDDDVAQLLAFPGDLFICDECIGLMVEIIGEKNKEWRERQIEVLTKLNSR
jgi:ATP-dependent Clp protease ATP-binding subunit ClpX